ncbi:MAG: hypothetical protein KAT00_01445 [Planctomycetes bacterium]|nr:hypothetical protein [Planctomycetota bacterium]
MNDSCKRLIELQTERTELLAMLADTGTRADKFETVIRDAIATLEVALPSRLAQALTDKLRDALEELDA